MSTIQSVLDAIRGKRQEKHQSVQEQYVALLDDLARGKEVDVDTLAEILDSLDKSDADLQADIDRKQQRFIDARNLEELHRLRKEYPTLEKEIADANAAMRDAIAKVQPRVNAAREAWESSTLRMSQIDNSEQRLVNTVLNPILIARRKELDTERRELHESARPIRERIDEMQKLIGSYRGQVAGIIDQLCINGITADHRSVVNNARILGLQRQTKEAELALAELHERLEPFTAQLAMVEQEFVELRAAELIP